MITLPLIFSPVGSTQLHGTWWSEIEHFYPGDRIRQVERASIRAFMEKYRDCLRGRVLDFGAGAGPYLGPYSDLVRGEYVPFEKEEEFPAGMFDAVMINQVMQYVRYPEACLDGLPLRTGGHLIMTYPTNWDEVEESDLWRFTKAGMERLLRATGFRVVAHELRASVSIGNFKFPLGYGLVAIRA